MQFCIKNSEKQYFSSDFEGNRAFGSFIVEFLELDIDDLFNEYTPPNEHATRDAVIYVLDRCQKLSEKYNTPVKSMLIKSIESTLINELSPNHKYAWNLEKFSSEFEKNYLECLKYMPPNDNKEARFYTMLLSRKDNDESNYTFIRDKYLLLQNKMRQLLSHAQNDYNILPKEVFTNSQNLNVSFRLDKDNKIYSVYETNSLSSLLSLDMVNIISNNIQIKQCANCGKFYIGRNSKYCVDCSAVAGALSDKKRQESKIKSTRKNIMDRIRVSTKISTDDKIKFQDESMYYIQLLEGKVAVDKKYTAKITNENDLFEWLKNQKKELYSKINK